MLAELKLKSTIISQQLLVSSTQEFPHFIRNYQPLHIQKWYFKTTQEILLEAASMEDGWICALN